MLTVNAGATAPAWAVPGSLPTYDAYISAISGLVQRWKFNEASGNFADSVGSLALTASGSISYQQTDPFGNTDAARFNTGSASSSGLGSIPTGGNLRTFVALLKSGMTGGTKSVLAYGTASTLAFFMYQLVNSGTVAGDYLDTWGTNNRLAALTSAADGGLWHLVALGNSQADRLEFWIDGVRQSYVLSNGSSLNTGTGNLVLNNDATDVTFADLAVFSTWIGTAKLSKLWDIVRAALW